MSHITKKLSLKLGLAIRNPQFKLRIRIVNFVTFVELKKNLFKMWETKTKGVFYCFLTTSKMVGSTQSFLYFIFTVAFHFMLILG